MNWTRGASETGDAAGVGICLGCVVRVQGPGEAKPREIHDFMSSAAMNLICGPAKDFNKAEIRPVLVDEKGEIIPCE